MNIGIVCLYSFRPHVEHHAYLAKLLREAGCQVSYLTCDGVLPNCYPRLLKNHSKVRECPKCVLGGIRSYSSKSVYKIKAQKHNELNPENLHDIVASSSYTLHRTEVRSDCEADEVIDTQNKLHKSAEIVYQNTKQ